MCRNHCQTTAERHSVAHFSFDTFLRLISSDCVRSSVVNCLTHGSISSINMMIRFRLRMITFKHILPSKLIHKCCFLHLLYAIKIFSYNTIIILRFSGSSFVGCSERVSKLHVQTIIIYHVFLEVSTRLCLSLTLSKHIDQLIHFKTLFLPHRWFRGGQVSVIC